MEAQRGATILPAVAAQAVQMDPGLREARAQTTPTEELGAVAPVGGLRVRLVLAQ